MPPPFLVLVSVLLDEKQLPRECGTSLYCRERVRRDLKDATTAPVYQSEDNSDQQMRRADKTERAVVNAFAHQGGDRAGKRTRKNDDVEVECLHALVRDKRKMLPSVIKAVLVCDARFGFVGHWGGKWPNDLKLSDGRGWRGPCMAGGKAAAEARAVTAGAVRCSAWLGRGFRLSLLVLTFFYFAGSRVSGGVCAAQVCDDLLVCSQGSIKSGNEMSRVDQKSVNRRCRFGTGVLGGFLVNLPVLQGHSDGQFPNLAALIAAAGEPQIQGGDAATDNGGDGGAQNRGGGYIELHDWLMIMGGWLFGTMLGSGVVVWWCMKRPNDPKLSDSGPGARL